LKDFFGVEWQNCKLLDVGCGQLLADALILGLANDVTAIDVELPLNPPYVPDFFMTMRRSGMQRALKTSVRQLLGVDSRFRRALRRRLNLKKLPKVKVCHMNAMKLTFGDASFDGAYSLSVFQHIDRPDLAAIEINRVLKPGGVAYIQFHLYTSMTGSDHPLIRTSPWKYPPWSHLRPSTPYYRKHGLHLNCWRLAHAKAAFENVFHEVRYVEIDTDRDVAKTCLTPSIRVELGEYTEEELLTTTVTAVCKKSL
jgi:SAM-dependent methyltransferase